MHKVFALIIVTISTCILQASVNSEYYYITHYTSENGVPHSLVFDIEQDKQGFIWVATNNGLGRFDGYDFKVFRPKKNEKNTISDKSITQIYFDRNDQMWLSIQGFGANKMNLNNEYFTKYYPDSNNVNAISGNDAFVFYEDQQGEFYIGTNRGVDQLIDYDTGFNNCVPAKEKKQLSIQQINQDKWGRIWYRSYSGIGFYDKNSGKVVSISSFLGNPFKEFSETNAMLIEDGKFLWIATKKNGLYCINIEQQKIITHYNKYKNIDKLFLSSEGDLYFIAYYPDSKLIVLPHANKTEFNYQIICGIKNRTFDLLTSYYEEKNVGIWVTFGEGLFKINQDFSLTEIKSKNASHNDLLTDNCGIHLLDKMGNLWLTSERNGIIKIDLYQKKFNTYKSYSELNNIISGSNISMVYEDSKNNLWVGCYGKGVTVFNRENQTFKDLVYEPTNNKKLIYRAPAGIVEDKQGFIWIGFYDGWVVRVNPDNFNVEYFTISEPGVNNFLGQGIRSIILDKQGDIWFASTSVGIIERISKTGEFIYHSKLYEDNYSLNSHYRFICQTSDELIWFGTQNGGLGKYNPNTKRFTHYKNNPNNNNSISGNTVYYVYEQNDSILWIGTDKGLNRFNKYNEKFTNYKPEKEGDLCGVYRIYPESDKYLWISGDCGIIKFNLESHKYVIYNKSDGLPGTEFNTTAGCLSYNGDIFLGSSKGLVSFNPSGISANPHAAKPALTQLKIFNRNVSAGDKILGNIILSKELTLTEKLVIPYKLNDFTLYFSALHYASPEKNKFEYKLDGYNSDWIQTTSERRWANFTGLEPGKYKFHLKATNNDGLLCKPENEVTLDIIIKPPFRKTWGFRIILVALFILIGYMISRMRLKSIKQQKILLERTVKKRTMELEVKNELLSDRQEEITKQNEELAKHRNHLEELVSERTTELEEAKEKAEESDRLKTAFLSNMSHEIRTPMNAILGFSGLLEDENISANERKDYIEIIQNNGKSLLNLLNDIIDISIIESGQLRINKSDVDIHNLIHEVTEPYIICNANRNASQIFTDLSKIAKETVIYTDPNRLKQILTNLIDNAMKYTKQGQVQISLTQTAKEMCFCIKDNGIGIDANHIDGIFDRFRKIEENTSEMYRGGGLGLAICKNLTEALGGKIWVESELGKGSKFCFTIKAS